jgi:hypothetical protein
MNNIVFKRGCLFALLFTFFILTSNADKQLNRMITIRNANCCRANQISCLVTSFLLRIVAKNRPVGHRIKGLLNLCTISSIESDAQNNPDI